MICKVDEKNKDRFLALCAGDEPTALRMETAFACYQAHPAVCSFYVSENAALMLSGDSLLCAGSFTNVEELRSFAAFCAVRRVEGAMPLAGFLPQKVLVLCRSKKMALPVEKAQTVTLEPDLWRLRESGLFTDKDGFYADACLRRRQGAVIAAAEENGCYLATAGIYAQKGKNAYLTGVATLPQHRKKGLATATVAALCRNFADKNIYLRCEEALLPFYARLGFALQKTQTDQILKEEDTIE